LPSVTDRLSHDRRRLMTVAAISRTFRENACCAPSDDVLVRRAGASAAARMATVPRYRIRLTAALASAAPRASKRGSSGPLALAARQPCPDVAVWPPQCYATVFEVMKRWMASLALS
jgi:hypothetical protein